VTVGAGRTAVGDRLLAMCQQALHTAYFRSAETPDVSFELMRGVSKLLYAVRRMGLVILDV
jgi:hypothetical protein